MEVLEIITIILAVSAIPAWYSVFILNKKCDTYEDVVENYDVIVDNLKIYMQQSLDKIKEIDIRGSFESDDEIGWVFKTIKEEIVKLDQLVYKTINEAKIDEQ
jgi:hypothetical protein